MWRMLFLSFVLGSFLVIAEERSANDSSAVDASLQALLALERSEQAALKEQAGIALNGGVINDPVGNALSTKYGQAIKPFLTDSFLASASKTDLAKLFLAAQTTAFYSYKRPHVADMERIFSMLERQKWAEVSQAAALHGALIAVRDLPAAQQLALRFHLEQSEPLPVIALAGDYKSKLPSVMVPQADGRRLLRKNVDLGVGLHMVAVVHPYCHFSIEAMTTISNDQHLVASLAPIATWLVNPDEQLLIREVQKWNDMHPKVPFELTYSPSDWPALTYWGTPTFYFFRDGQLKRVVTGWSGSETKEKIESTLAELGDQKKGAGATN